MKNKTNKKDKPVKVSALWMLGFFLAILGIVAMWGIMNDELTIYKADYFETKIELRKVLDATDVYEELECFRNCNRLEKQIKVYDIHGNEIENAMVDADCSKCDTDVVWRFDKDDCYLDENNLTACGGR